MSKIFTTPVSNGGEYSTGWEKVDPGDSLSIAIKTDQDCTLFVDQSLDKENADSTLTFQINAAVNEVHRLTIVRSYYRVRIQNNSGVDQTYFRGQTRLGKFQLLSSGIRSLIQSDSDSIIARTIDSEVGIASGLFDDISIVNKFGTNSDISANTTPEDIWEGGGPYTGWATTAEQLRVTSSSALDAAAGTGARQVRVTGLDTNFNVIQETITLSGLTPALSVASFIRVHTATVISAGSGGVNAGTLIIGQNITVANIFATIGIGRNQSNVSAYTVPAGHTAYLRGLHCATGHNQAAYLEGHIWTRAFGMPFRSRRPFFFADRFRLFDEIYGGLVFTEKSDIILRIQTSSGNTIKVNGGYDLILIKDV